MTEKLNDADRNLAANIAIWREDPVKFAKDVFGVTCEPFQVEFLESLADTKDEKNRRICMVACAGPGKTMILAIAIWWFMLTQGEPGEHPKGAAVSINGPNMDQNLWSELSKWYMKAPLLQLLFEKMDNEIRAKNPRLRDTWSFAKRTWDKSAESSHTALALSGGHSKYTLFVLDESGGIPLSVVQAGERYLATTPKDGFGKIIQAGNPTHTEGPLWEAAKEHPDKWRMIRVTGDPDDPKRASRVSVDWAREQIDRWGRDNPYVRVFVLGEFPAASLNALLGPDDVYKAMHRNPTPDMFENSQKRIGVDVARFGDDQTVLLPRQGLMVGHPIFMRHATSPEVAGRVMAAKSEWKSELVLVDNTGGFGAGVIDFLHQAGYSPIPVEFSGKPIDPRFANKRAEMWWLMAEAIKHGDLCLPDISGLSKQLTYPTYTFDNRGKILIEPKEAVKNRLGESPDTADALAITFALPEDSSEMGESWRPQRNTAELGGDSLDDVDKRAREWGKI